MARRKVKHPRKKKDTESGGPFGQREILLVAVGAVVVVALVIFFGGGIFNTTPTETPPADNTVHIDSGDRSLGPSNAPVTVMEFSDFQ